MKLLLQELEVICGLLNYSSIISFSVYKGIELKFINEIVMLIEHFFVAL
jgi:hypothetical protein